jgi:hypothetical protein
LALLDRRLQDFGRPDNPILHCGGPSDLPSGSQSLHIDLAESRFRHPISSIPGVTELNVFQLLAFFINCK